MERWDPKWADEDIFDKCSSRDCNRLGIWYHKGKAYCDKHWGIKRRSQAFFDKNVAEGKCQCGRAEPLPGQKLCQACKDKLLRIRNGYAEAGLCKECDRCPPDGTYYCSDCKKKHAYEEKRRQRREKQLA